MTDDLRLPPESEDIWELTMFLSKENLVLRSFLDYLRTQRGNPDIKMDQLVHWEKHVGFQLGDPSIDADAKSMIQTLLDAPAEERQEAIHKAIGVLQSKYFRETEV
jgi:hypothetical protein